MLNIDILFSWFFLQNWLLLLLCFLNTKLILIELILFVSGLNRKLGECVRVSEEQLGDNSVKKMKNQDDKKNKGNYFVKHPWL